MYVSLLPAGSACTTNPGRMSLPWHLPVAEIIIEPVEDTTGMKCIGREVTDQLELLPAKLYIKKYIRPKYIKQGDDGLTSQGIIAPYLSFSLRKA